MKRYGLIVLLFFVFSLNSAFGYEFKKITDDERIINALSVLKETDSKETLESLFKRDKNGKYTQIIFYDLGMISYEYKKHYATTSKDNFGDNYIIINAKYRNAPKEALAALIAHETCHKLERADLKEEQLATLEEIKQWKKSSDANPKLKELEDPLIQRLNRLSEIYDKDGEAAIEEYITGNDFYKARLL